MWLSQCESIKWLSMIEFNSRRLNSVNTWRLCLLHVKLRVTCMCSSSTLLGDCSHMCSWWSLCRNTLTFPLYSYESAHLPVSFGEMWQWFDVAALWWFVSAQTSEEPGTCSQLLCSRSVSWPWLLNLGSGNNNKKKKKSLPTFTDVIKKSYKTSDVDSNTPSLTEDTTGEYSTNTGRCHHETSTFDYLNSDNNFLSDEWNDMI